VILALVALRFPSLASVAVSGLVTSPIPTGHDYAAVGLFFRASRGSLLPHLGIWYRHRGAGAARRAACARCPPGSSDGLFALVSPIF